MKFATAPPLALWSGTASAYLVKYFVATSIHMYPRDGGSPVQPSRASKCGRAMVWPYRANSTDGCGSNWLVFGNCGIFLQILPHLSLW